MVALTVNFRGANYIWSQTLAIKIRSHTGKTTLYGFLRRGLTKIFVVGAGSTDKSMEKQTITKKPAPASRPDTRS
jgi:hypothetical protein